MKIDSPVLDWWAFAPELVLGVASIVVLLMGLARGRRARVLNVTLTLGALTAAVTIALIRFDERSLNAWAGQLDVDPLANVVRILAAGAGIAAVLFILRGGRAEDDRDGEYLSLILAAVCGMGLMGASGSLVSLFVGLELFSIALYVLCALEAERVSSLEAGLKYLIMGGLGTAFLVYGAALVYGGSGSFDLSEIGAADGGLLLDVGMGMLVVVLAFKASAAPVHWWTPDVYDGAPMSITAFMAVATKVAALVAIIRVLVVAFPDAANIWEPLIAGIAAVSIIVGNLGALVQHHVKRMLAYSSVAFAGYLLCAVVGWEGTGVPALVYALCCYAAMTLGAFALVHRRERQLGRPVTYGDFAGVGWGEGSLGPGHALPGIALVIIMLSLAGIPPTGGFFAKFGLFDAALGAGYEWLAFVGVLGSVISLAYYLRVPVAMYMQSPIEGQPAPLDHARIPATIGVVLGIATLALAFAPGPFLEAGCDARTSLGKQSAADLAAECGNRVSATPR